MGARPGTGLGQPQWLQTSPKDPPVGKKNQVWQRARLASSSDLQRPAPQGPVPLPPTELEARRRLRPRARGVRSGFALLAPAGGVSCCASHPSLPGRVWVALEVRSADPPGGPRRPCPGPAAASAWHGSGGGRAAAVGVCVSPAACLWPWAVAAPPRRASHGGHSRLRPRAACVGRLRSASTRQHVWGHCPPGSPRVRRGSDSVVRGASQATHTPLGDSPWRSREGGRAPRGAVWPGRGASCSGPRLPHLHTGQAAPMWTWRLGDSRPPALSVVSPRPRGAPHAEGRPPSQSQSPCLQCAGWCHPTQARDVFPQLSL